MEAIAGTVLAARCADEQFRELGRCGSMVRRPAGGPGEADAGSHGKSDGIDRESFERRSKIARFVRLREHSVPLHRSILRYRPLPTAQRRGSACQSVWRLQRQTHATCFHAVGSKLKCPVFVASEMSGFRVV